MKRFRLRHVTSFRYAQPVTASRQLLHLTPRKSDGQQVLRSTLVTEPVATRRNRRIDYFGNPVVEVDITTEHRTLQILSEAIVDVTPPQDVLLNLSPPWEQVAAQLQAPGSEDAWDAARYCFPSPWITLDGASGYAEPTMTAARPLLQVATELTARIYQDFKYEGGVTDVYTPVEAVLAAGRGVCQDFAHLAIACLRAYGLAARYVSGYLLTHPAPGQPRLTGADASHAWLAVWCPQFGWVDFDPTNNIRPWGEHIVVGWGRDYGDVAPSVGVLRGGGRQRLDVSVDVAPMSLTESTAERS